MSSGAAAAPLPEIDVSFFPFPRQIAQTVASEAKQIGISHLQLFSHLSIDQGKATLIIIIILI